MKRTALLIAFHFPPVGFSSGVQRTLSLARYLPKLGWRPVVLTVWPGAYPSTNSAQLDDVPAEVSVHRLPALDTSRHLALFGRYPGRLAVPDRWTSWRLSARIAAGRILAREKPDVIWSTYPIATAHAIGAQFAKSSGLPWVADFRDSMTEEGYPANPAVRRRFLEIEERAINNAKVCTFTAPGTVGMYRKRFPQQADKFRVIANGYDEEVFLEVESEHPAGQPAPAGKFVHLVHSGTLYPSERDPRAFFDALASLKQKGAISAEGLQISLRATGHDELIANLIRERSIGDLISIKPPVDYRAALGEMMSADGLIILQSSNCNHQIPAKLYEYARCGKPVLALTDPAGDTARTLLEARAGEVIRLDDKDAITRQFPDFLARVRASEAALAEKEWLARHSRQALAASTAAALERAISA